MPPLRFEAPSALLSFWCQATIKKVNASAKEVVAVSNGAALCDGLAADADGEQVFGGTLFPLANIDGIKVRHGVNP